MWNEQPANDGTEDAKRTGDNERILASADLIRSIVLGNWQDIGSDKRADFSHSSCDTIVLTADSRCAALRCDKTDVVTGTKFAKGGEDTALCTTMFSHIAYGMFCRDRGRRLNLPEDNDKGSNVFRGSKLFVGSSHDEAYNTLREHTPGQSLLRTVPVGKESACHRARQIEGVGDDGPGKALPKRSRVAQDNSQPFGRVDAEGETGEVVHEPD